MGKKYEKPEANDLGAGARGDVQVCSSGGFVGDCDPNGGTAGICGANGITAGDCASPGTSVAGVDCADGSRAVNCDPLGGFASPY